MKLKLRFKDLIITPQELISLFSHADNIDQNEIRKSVYNIYKGIAFGGFFNIFVQIGLIYIVLRANELLINNSFALFVVIVLVIFIFELACSTITNRYIYHGHDILIIDKFALLKEYLFKYFDPEQSKIYNETYKHQTRYFYNLHNLFKNLSILLVFAITIIYGNTTNELKTTILLITSTMILTILISGRVYYIGAKNVYDNALEHKPFKRKHLYLRVLFPSSLNTFTKITFPVIFVVLATFGINGLIPQMALLAGVVSFSWEIISYFEQFYYAKINTRKLNNFLDKLTSENVVNEKGFNNQVALTKTSNKLIMQSKINKSLILKDFIPKYISNGTSTKRKFNIELKPGLYQVNGVNGIGKTTLLESITLTEEELVELSYGQATFNGKPLYNPKSNLKRHRQKYKYIGRYSTQYKLTSKLLAFYEKNKAIHKFLIDLKTDKKQKYSEGEKAIVAICHTLASIKDSSILVVDELISRVYEDEITPLRSNIMDIIEKFAYKNGHIVFIVDHVLRIPNARQLKLTETDIIIMTSK